MDKRSAFEIASKYINYLINDKNYQIKRAFIFGSYAKDKFHSDSDIDIALVMTNVQDIIDLQIQLMVLRRDFSIDIEPHPISENDFNSTNPFAYEVIKTGIEFKYDNTTRTVSY